MLWSPPLGLAASLQPPALQDSVALGQPVSLSSAWCFSYGR